MLLVVIVLLTESSEFVFRLLENSQVNGNPRIALYHEISPYTTYLLCSTITMFGDFLHSIGLVHEKGDENLCFEKSSFTQSPNASTTVERDKGLV
jgi:hypothetical protein